MTLIERIGFFILSFSAFFCIILFSKKKKSDSLIDFLSQKKYVIIVFVVYLALYSWYLIWKDSVYKQRYQQIYKHSFNDTCSVSDYGHGEIKLQFQDDREYIFIPNNMNSSDFIKDTNEMGYWIEKKANSDTIFLVKGDSTKFCLIKKYP